MNIAALRERIRVAEQQEQQQGSLRKWLGGQMEHLHPAIEPGSDPLDTLHRFAEGYIAEVPDTLEAAQAVAESANMRTQLLPVLKVAEAFFLQPPDLPADHQGMLALLDEAYLVHRLVEEINDRYIAHGGEPLLPLDTTRANVIVHQLLGDAFANQLDMAVDTAVEGLAPESLFNSKDFADFRQIIAQRGRIALWQNWPCLSRQLGVEIRLREAS
ncbi:MAG: hypothetical protein KBT85_05910 [Pseudomonas sp.]|nr:hypothetical protein [Pseudomonas sp.]